MNQKLHKILSSVFVSCLALGGFLSLIYLANLNQLPIFSALAFKLWLVFCVFVVLFYDLHFKKTGSWQWAKLKPQAAERFFAMALRALWRRLEHLRSWHAAHLWWNYLLLPSMIFWSTAAILYIKMGSYKIQYLIALLSSAALVANYWYLKEIFSRKKEKVDYDIFIRLSVIKIYASAIVFGSALALVRRFCLPAYFLELGIFCLTFLLIYQALFQHRMLVIKNLLMSVLIGAVMAAVAFFVLKFWGYDNVTAAAFMTICYNLMWGTFHYHLDKTLTRQAFLEILVFSLILGFMIFSATNFKARLLDGCVY